MAPPLPKMWRFAERELLAVCGGSLVALCVVGYSDRGDLYWCQDGISYLFLIAHFVNSSGNSMHASIRKLPGYWLLGWVLTRWLLRRRQG